MTEPHLPLSDEDLSAALDGMAGPDVEARIQADPSARDRLDALRAASEAIRTPPVAEPGTFDALIARAIEEGTDGTNAESALVTPPASPDDVVAPLTPRHRTSPGVQRWLVAAVIVALVAIGLGLVYSGTRDSGSQDAAVSTQADRSTTGNEPDVSASSGNDAGNLGTGTDDHSFEADPDQAESPLNTDADAMQPADLDQLGSFEQPGDLRTALRDGFPRDAAVVPGDGPNNAAVVRCQDFIQTILGDESLSPEPDEVGQANVDGEEYLVYEFSVTNGDAGGSKLITAADLETCDPLFTFVR